MVATKCGSVAQGTVVVVEAFQAGVAFKSDSSVIGSAFAITFEGKGNYLHKNLIRCDYRGNNNNIIIVCCKHCLVIILLLTVLALNNVAPDHASILFSFF